MEKKDYPDQRAESQQMAPVSRAMADAIPAPAPIPAPASPVAPEPQAPPVSTPVPVGDAPAVPRRRLPRLGRHPRLRPIHIHVRVHTLDSLRYRDYRLFWFSTLFMSGGLWVYELVIGWLTYDLTRSPLLTSLALGLGTLPYLLVAPVGGVLADRFDRRKVLVANAAYQAVLTAGFSALVVMGVAATWHIFAFILAIGVSAAVHDPTRFAIVPSLVPRQNLVNAVALQGLAFNVARLAVPAAAGLLIALLGPGRTLFVASALYLSAAAAVQAMDLARGDQRDAAQDKPLTKLMEGARYVKSEPLVLTLILLGGVPLLVIFPFVHGLLPVYAAEVFEVGPTGLGLLLSSLGVGASVGTVIIASLGDFAHKGRYMLVGLALVVASTVFFSHTPSFISPLLVLMFMAGSLTTYFTLSGAVLYSVVPDNLRGRVSSLGVMTWGLLPLASLLSGGLATLLGAPTATLIGAVFVTVLLAAVTSRQVV